MFPYFFHFILFLKKRQTTRVQVIFPQKSSGTYTKRMQIQLLDNSFFSPVRKRHFW